MALNQRRVKILHLIREDGHAKVQDLSKIFNVTDVTIRQDLEALEQMGYIQREHGGAFLKGVGSFAKTGQLFNQTHLEEKKEIAQKAIQFIQEGDSIKYIVAWVPLQRWKTEVKTAISSRMLRN